MTQQPPPPYGDQPPGDQPYQPYGQGQPYHPEQPYAAPANPVYGYGYGVSHGGATSSLVLGITSIVVAIIGTCMCLFLGVAAAIIGPFGIWQAVKARREIDAAPAQYVNRGAAVAGLATSIVGTVLGCLVVVGTILVIAFYGFVFSAASVG